MGVGTNVWRLTVLGCCIIQLKDHVFEVSSVEGDSMGPTLSPTFHETGQQDAVFVTKFRKTPTKEDSPAVRSWNAEDIRRGDVVFFWSPFNNKERMGVKRVVALAGDTVMPGRRARYGAGYRDMQDDEAALNVARDLVKGRGRIGNPDVVKIPYGHVWVEGDNSERSMDSRDYGPISQALITGKARYVVWPWHRAGPILTEVAKSTANTKTKVIHGNPTVPREYLE